MFKIGNIIISSNTVLAPMAGVNCTAFRIQCKKYGCGLVYTQMYKIHVLLEKFKEDMTGKKLKEFLNIKDIEHPIAIQLAGNIKDDWKLCIEILNSDPIKNLIDIIDINCGCPEPDIYSTEAGGYLMKETKNLQKIIQICVTNSKIPITAKIRSGWNNDSINALETCKMLIKEKINAITIHPRTVLQKYGGKADWTIIKEIKSYCNNNNITIPIIGNGDVSIPGHAKAMIEQTKCDAVMLGRISMKDPEMFERINYILKYGKNKEKYTKDSKNPLKLISEFIELYENNEHRQSINEIKDHIIWLLTETKEKKYLKEIMKLNSIKEIKNKIKEIESEVKKSKVK